MVEEPQTEAVKESTDRQPLANLGQLCIESFHSPDFYPLFSPNVQHKKFANADLFSLVTKTEKKIEIIKIENFLERFLLFENRRPNVPFPNLSL